MELSGGVGTPRVRLSPAGTVKHCKNPIGEMSLLSQGLFP